MPETNRPGPEVLDAWTAALCDRFGVDPAEVPVSLILDTAGDAAHGVTRPAAPLSTFIAGLVVGRSGLPVEEVTAVIRSLAAGWGGEQS